MSKFIMHIIIVGTARSGTSWLAETIAHQHRYRMLFEPEQETRTKRGYLLCDQWIETKEEAPEADTYLNKVFANRVDCNWIAQNSNRTLKRHLWSFIPKKYIIKFVRANLLAKYMNEVFKIPVVHIIRNPYDVLLSQQRVKFPWLLDLSHFVKQDKLVALIKNNFMFDINNYTKLSDLEILTLRWCIENVIPLEVLEPYQYDSLVIKHEDLVSDIQLFYKLCKRFHLDPVKNLEQIYIRPSSKTHYNSTIITKRQAKEKWSLTELKLINGILDIFKTTLYDRKY